MVEKQELENKRIYGDAEDFQEKVKIQTGGKNTIVVGDLACLSIVLYDDTGFTPIANTDYYIEGPNGREYSGTTDDAGYLFHPDVPIDDYDLTVGETTVKVPVVENKKERHLQRVIDYVIP
ncbi:MAG: hypothetical protein ACFFCW_18360 [Candidatus Hodarchaeota archaeon]